MIIFINWLKQIMFAFSGDVSIHNEHPKEVSQNETDLRTRNWFKLIENTFVAKGRGEGKKGLGVWNEQMPTVTYGLKN